MATASGSLRPNLGDRGGDSGGHAIRDCSTPSTPGRAPARAGPGPRARGRGRGVRGVHQGAGHLPPPRPAVRLPAPTCCRGAQHRADPPGPRPPPGPGAGPRARPGGQHGNPRERPRGRPAGRRRRSARCRSAGARCCGLPRSRRRPRAELAQRWGMAPNSVSQLASRAREGLRQQYLTAHLAADLPGELPRGGAAHGRRGARQGGRRHERQLSAHLGTCGTLRPGVRRAGRAEQQPGRAAAARRRGRPGARPDRRARAAGRGWHPAAMAAGLVAASARRRAACRSWRPTTLTAGCRGPRPPPRSRPAREHPGAPAGSRAPPRQGAASAGLAAGAPAPAASPGITSGRPAPGATVHQVTTAAGAGRVQPRRHRRAGGHPGRPGGRAAGHRRHLGRARGQRCRDRPQAAP